MIRKFFETGFKVLGNVSGDELFAPERATEVQPETKVEETKVEEPKPEVQPEVKAEEIKPEPIPEKPVEKVAEPTPPKLDEVLKNADRNEALKILGLDEFDLQLINYRQEHGDLTPFLQAKTVDWDKVTDVAILRDNLKRQFPEVLDEEFELLVEKRINEKYLLNDPEVHDEKAVKLAKIELKTDAANIRKQRKDEQAKFDVPVKQVVKEDTEAKQQEAIKAYEAYVESVKNNPVTQKLLSEQKLVMGEGKDTYNYKVEPNDIIAIAENPQKFWELFGEAGKENWDDFYATVAYAKNRKGIEKALIEYGKSLAIKEDTETLENPKKDEPGKAAPAKESLGKALASRGVPYSMT